jgi:phage terminase large subunit GpA-like protein
VDEFAKPDIDYAGVFGETDRQFVREQFLVPSKSRRVRSIAEWAEDEIIIPTGPFEGLKFKMDRQPVAHLLYNEFNNPHFQEYSVVGSTQTGKSFLGFALPVCWLLCEKKEDVIIAAPTKEILADKVKRDIYPILEASKYADIIPTKGGGSKGGIPDRIDMRNGTVLKLMSFEGGDKSKASFTCSNIIMTEVDGSKAQTTSQEANPIEQIKARARATEREKRFVMYECTVSTESGNIWQLYSKQGSEAHIMLKCPYCNEWSRPDRPDLKGWEKATSEIEAERMGAWHCPKCDHAWTEADRKKANLNAKLMHRGQRMEGDEVVGDLPPTRTLGFRFSAVNNLFLPAKDIAVDCWNVMQDEDDLDGEKKLTQFVFALPYEPPGLDLVKMDRDKVEKRQLSYPKGSPPRDTKWITIGLDVGKFDCHWTAIAWLIPRRVGLIMDYGKIRLRMHLKREDRWVNANDVGFDQVFTYCMNEWKGAVDGGWPDSTGLVYDFDALWIDSRYQGDDPDLPVVYNWIKSTGDKRVLPIMGHSKNAFKRSNYRSINPTAKDLVKRGHMYDIRYIADINMHRGHIDSDGWKTIVQRCILRDEESEGALMLYSSVNPREHATFVKHLDAEVRERRFEPGKGEIEEWVVKREANHFLDSTVYACAAGHHAGFRTSVHNEPKRRKMRAARRTVSGPGGQAFVATQRR